MNDIVYVSGSIALSDFDCLLTREVEKGSVGVTCSLRDSQGGSGHTEVPAYFLRRISKKLTIFTREALGDSLGYQIVYSHDSHGIYMT